MLSNDTNILQPLRQSIVGNLCPLLRNYLEAGKEQVSTFMDNMIVCWARLVSIVTEEGALVRPITPSAGNSTDQI